MPLRSIRVFALLACVAAAVGCAQAGDGGGSSASLHDYLGQLPAPADPGDVVLVNYADLARATEIGGLTRPDDPGDVDGLRDWLQGITGQVATDGHAVAVVPPTAAEIIQAAGDPQAFVDDVGWSIVQVDSYAERDTAPERVTVLDGRFDGDRLAGALDDAGDGVWVAGDPDRQVDPDGTTPARPIGQPLWLTLDGHRLRVTGTEDDVAPEGDTLADDAALSALAGALDDHEVYTAMLTAGGSLGGGDIVRDVLDGDVTISDPTCQGLTGAAVGVADDGEPLIVLALTQPDGDADHNAEAVSDALEDGDAVTGRPWSDLVTVESVDVEDGVVVATMRPAPGTILGSWVQFLVARAFPPC